VVITFDPRQLVDDLLLTEQQARDAIDFSIKEITASFAREWGKQATQKLGSSRAEYISSLVVIDEGYGKGAVILRGWLPNAVESGVTAYDMKEGMLNGPNAKVGKNGNRYNTIPFRVGVPGSQPENFNGGILPVEVYEVVRNKEAGKPLTSQDVPQGFREPKIHSVGSPEAKNFRQYQHKSSIYEGVTKNKDSVTGQNTYGSFRRVSDNSDPDSWLHPGIEAHHIAEETMNNFDVPAETGKAIDNYLKSIGWQ
jgi:hypothetical protein